jgi:hypothetical protein
MSHIISPFLFYCLHRSSYFIKNRQYGVVTSNYGNYGGPTNYSPENYGYGGPTNYSPENYGYGGPTNYSPENYGYGGPTNYSPENYGYGQYGVTDSPENYSPENYGRVRRRTSDRDAQ